MSCEIAFLCECFAAFVALERPLPRVRPHVALQMTRLSKSGAALVTLERLLSCVVPHHVHFQFTSLNTGKLARCASVRLFPWVGPFVLNQIVWCNWSIIALVASVWFLPRMGSFVPLQMAWSNCSIVALVAFVWFLSSVNEEVYLQFTSLAKWLVAPGTIVLLDSTVGLLMLVKALSTCKCLGTLVTRLSIWHLI